MPKATTSSRAASSDSTTSGVDRVASAGRLATPAVRCDELGGDVRPEDDEDRPEPRHDRVYEDLAIKFFLHFLEIAKAMTSIAGSGVGLWDEREEFYFDCLVDPEG